MSTDEKLAVVLVLFAALVAFIIWAARRWLATRTDQAEFDADLDETRILELTHDETIPVPMGGPPMDEIAAPVPVSVPPLREVPGRDPAVAAAAKSLTGPQRRRAVHKGRIPRDIPAPVSDRSAARTFPMSADASTSRGGESTERLISGILAAELDAGRWLAAEADRAREEETLRERAELDARIDEAYRVVGAGFADLEARNWLELAA